MNKSGDSFVLKFLERFSVQIASFITTLVLARLLTPEEYGTVSLVTIFISIATVFVQGGFNTALIQKAKIKEVDISTVFYFSLLVSFIFYILLFITAPLIADFYGQKIIIQIVRVVALSLFPGALNSVQLAILTRNMEFKKILKSSVFASIISSILGIGSALIGFGIWAIVIWQLSNTTFTAISCFFLISWKPKMIFSIDSLKNLIPFGSKILMTNLLVTVFQNIRSLVIGRVYSTEDLAYFNKGRQFPQVIMEGINGSIQSVSLPIFSRINEQNILKKEIRKISSVSYYIIFPMLIGLATVADPLIRILLTDKWSFAIPFLQIFSLTYLVQPPQIICAEALKAKGLTNVTLFLEIIRKTLEIILLIIFLNFGTIWIAISGLIAGIIAIIVSLYPNKKYLSYTYKEQIIDILFPLLISCLMGVIILIFSTFLNFNLIINLFLEIAIGIISYLILSYIFKLDALKICLNYVINIVKKEGII